MSSSEMGLPSLGSQKAGNLLLFLSSLSLKSLPTRVLSTCELPLHLLPDMLPEMGFERAQVRQRAIALHFRSHKYLRTSNHFGADGFNTT